MKNAIYKICEKLHGYSDATEYFEILEIRQQKNGSYIIVVKAVETKPEKGADDESNE